MGRRRQARETALQALYLTDVSSITAGDAYEAVCMVEEGLDEKSGAFAKQLVEGAADQRKDLDERIQKTAKNWELHRMASVDRSILRMAAYELLHLPETPVNVVIDEALEVAKKYSSENSSRFINGLLDKLKEKDPK